MGLSLRNIGKKIGDVVGGVERQLNPFDNNATYQNPQGNGQQQSAAHQAAQFGQGIVSPVVKGVNTVEAGLGGLYGLGQILAAKSTHNKQAEINAISRTEDTLNSDLAPNSGFLSQGTFFSSPQEAANLTPRQLAGKSLAYGSQLASFATPELKAFDNPIANRVLTNAVVGGAGTAGGEYAQTGHVTPKQVAQGAATSAALGEVLPTVKSFVKATGERVPLNEVGSVGKEVNKPPSALPEETPLPTTPSDKPVVKAVGKGSEVDKYATTFGVSKDQAVRQLNAIDNQEKAINQRRVNEPAPGTGPVSTKVERQLNPEPLGKLPQNPLRPVELPKVTNAREAIRASESLSSDFAQRANVLAHDEDVLIGKSGEARDLYYHAIEHPSQIDQVAEAFGPKAEAFKNLIAQHKAVTDLEHSFQMGASNPRPYLGGPDIGYVHHNVDLSTPEAEATYNALLDKVSRGGSAIKRLYPTLEELRGAGLDITDQSAGDATRQWAGTQTRILRDAALADRMSTIDPNFTVVNNPREGTSFHSSNPEFNKQLKGVQPYHVATVMKPVNALNTALKQIGLFGGGFHDLKTSIRQFTTDLASARNPLSRLAEGNKQLLSNEAHESWVADHIDQGYGKLWADADVASKNVGADLHSSISGDLKKGSVEKLNPYMKRLFGNKLDYFKKQFVIDEAKRNGITPANYDPIAHPEQLKILQQAGEGAQNWFGGLNQRVLGKSPVFQQILKYVTLAPDFTEGKLRAIGNVVKKGEAGSVARRQIFSEAIGVAILAEGLSKATTGQFTNPAQAFINPQIKTPLKDKKGRALVVGLPGSEIADVNRAITQPGHFIQSHSAALPSTVVSAVTGKDYYGNPLVDPYKNPNPSFLQNLEEAAKNKGTIPGVQIAKTVSGKQNVATAVINTLGGRVSLDKSTPQYKQNQAYFDTRSKVLRGLNPTDAGQVNNYFLREKTPDGKTIQLAPSDSMSQARALFSNPTALSAVQKIQTATDNHDPMWDLPPDQLKTFINYQSQIKDSADQLNLRDNNPWINDLAAKRSQFYAGLTKSGNSVVNPDTPVYPLTKDEGALMGQVAQITDPAQKAQFYTDHPELTQIDQKYGQYVNAVRKQEGAAPLPAPPIPDAATKKIIDTYNAIPKGGGKRGGNLYRSQWITAHPTEYAQMANYFTQASLYSLLKQASAEQLNGNAAGNQKLLKAAYSLGRYDIVKNKDGTYSLGNGSGSSSSSGGYSSRYSGKPYVSRTQAELQNPYYNAIDISAGGKKNIVKAKAVQGARVVPTGGFKAKVGSAKAKVSRKASKV